MATNIPLVQDYTGDIALRSDPENFDENAENQYTYLALFSTDWNVTITAMNTAIGETQDYANSAGASASSASDSAASSASSALISESNANFKGKWDDATGASTVPASYWHNGANWQMLVDIANITLSEPSADNDDWSVIITPALSEPDVKISFNDGITMERGYGAVDSNGNRAIDFTRASASGNINKSGVSVDLAVDEAGITSDGLSVYEEATNELLWSEDLSNATWVKPAATVVDQDGTLSSDGVTQAWRISSTYSETVKGKATGLSLIGSSVLMYAEVKKGTSNEARVRWANLSGGSTQDKTATIDLLTGEVLSSDHDYIKVEALNNGWFGVHFSNVTNDSGNTDARIDIGNGEAVNNNDIYASKCMIVNEFSKKLAYIKTTTAPVTRAPDIASIPMMNNMPAAGMPFTVTAEASINNNGIVAFLFETESRGIALYLTGDGGIAIRNKTTQTSIAVNVEDGLYIVTLVFDGAEFTGYINGAKQLTRSTFLPDYEITKNLNIGANTAQGSKINSEIKNFEIFHKALSSEEIAARGGPK